ncbi:MAG TPA: zinc ribbon domain-containing protein [Candidatus Thermoplasmatota archaeon]|nr:zinc ribbon domain-containing protein [Candidatus Thermoplasmatota archaeon]
MTRIVQDAVRARGSLEVDPKSAEGEAVPERSLAWDEDHTTLAIEAASHLAKAPVALVGPGIDAETVKLALDVPAVFAANDPMGVAKGMTGLVLAVGCPPGTANAIAALVADGWGAEPPAPRDVGRPARLVTASRALAESRRVPPTEPMPDSPMGAYVPWGTWVEDLPARLRLLAQRCHACARLQYPPRASCVACGGRLFSQEPLPREARVYAATRIGRGGAPSEFALEQAQVGAYWVGVVEWPELGVRVTARLAGYDEEGPAIGAPVRAVVRRLFDQEGKTRYGVKFAP